MSSRLKYEIKYFCIKLHKNVYGLNSKDHLLMRISRNKYTELGRNLNISSDYVTGYLVEHLIVMIFINRLIMKFGD